MSEWRSKQHPWGRGALVWTFSILLLCGCNVAAATARTWPQETGVDVKVANATSRLPVGLQVVKQAPSPTIVTNSGMRKRIKATGLPWRVKHTASGIELLLIPSGHFMRMLPPSERIAAADKGGPFKIKISKPFYLARTEVTQAQWKKLVPRAKAPSRFEGPSRPVEGVSWNNIRSALSKTELKLPTEAQWEYACRAGTTAPGYGPLNAIAWHRGNSKRATHDVAKKAANAWGLHDMLGNVHEWCLDWGGRYIPGPLTDPTGPAKGTFHVFRGGSWIGSGTLCDSGSRFGDAPDIRRSSLGFRVAATPLPRPPVPSPKD